MTRPSFESFFCAPMNFSKYQHLFMFSQTTINSVAKYRGYADDVDMHGSCVATAKLSGKLLFLKHSPFTGLDTRLYFFPCKILSHVEDLLCHGCTNQFKMKSKISFYRLPKKSKLLVATGGVSVSNKKNNFLANWLFQKLANH